MTMHPSATLSAPQAGRAPEPVPVAAPPSRLASLDVFRGITVAGMLLVNNPGSWSHVYDPLEHAKWHGWTPTDLIFPFFLFIVGVAMAFSFPAQAAKGAGRGELLRRAAKRSAVLVLLGLTLAAFPFYDLDPGTLRIPGVLQRIGAAFLLASAVVLFTGARAQALVAALLLLGYWAAMRLVPVPGHGAGSLEPDANLAAYVDRAVLGTAHLWKASRTWDPEGLLSTLPAVATVLLGVLAGRWLRSDRAPAEKAVWMFLAGNAGLLLGLAWHESFPINKNLWTSSYVVFTAGMALHFLAACYWLVDVKGWRRWAFPFVLFGVNAIAAFFLSGIMARLLTLVKWAGPAGDPVTLKGWIHQALFASWLSPVNASLAFAACFVLFWTGVMWVFYRRRIFIKV
ncbi:MAG TPA: heparan-alpha-glucosaminide N-acetyltransferase domain-containing protein [Longimicrobiaceae bacterium]|nr:heparan-alpha-glucosaminide N-acetyltransferase domain-containing protein [Longimicrobiaceae bacterium]